MNRKWSLSQDLVLSLIICFFAIALISLCVLDCRLDLGLPPEVASIVLVGIR
jgi:hypothetical protein